MFIRERHIFPPPGTTASPFGLAPYGSGSAPLRRTCGSACSASQKTKPSSATSSETFGFPLLRSAGRFAPHKSVNCEVVASLTLSTTEERQAHCVRTKASFLIALGSSPQVPLRGRGPFGSLPAPWEPRAQGHRLTSATPTGHKGINLEKHAHCVRLHKGIFCE